MLLRGGEEADCFCGTGDGVRAGTKFGGCLLGSSHCTFPQLNSFLQPHFKFQSKFIQVDFCFATNRKGKRKAGDSRGKDS